MLRQPRPAPHCHSASAQALASFWSAVGTPKRVRKGVTTSTRSQPGRLGGERIRPCAESNGPPQLTPTPESVTSWCAASKLASV